MYTIKHQSDTKVSSKCLKELFSTSLEKKSGISPNNKIVDSPKQINTFREKPCPKRK